MDESRKASTAASGAYCKGCSRIVELPGRLIEAFERLEPRAGKLACVVLREVGAGNSPYLPVLRNT